MPRPMLVSKEEIIAAAEELCAEGLINDLNRLHTVIPPSADIGMAPVQKTKLGLSHTLYVDGHEALDSHEYTEWLCPICDWFVGAHRSTIVGEKKKPCNFCTRCGQRIDWSGIELDDNYDTPTPIPGR